ncbi:MAG: CBS domain-containing protein [Thermodesulfovibrio sp.]|nr:CBS domain-containing protein [Thermodesulfovibrio sp.]
MCWKQGKLCSKAPAKHCWMTSMSERHIWEYNDGGNIMFVSDWMTRKVFTVAPDSSVTEAMTLMRSKKIRHIPVVKDDKLKGIVSDRDIRDYSPSCATALDVYELHYILAKAKIKDIMKGGVVTVASDTPVEEAAMLLFDRNIGCLPVMEEGRIVGIISDRDIFRALIDITGVRHGGHRICLTVDDRPGSIREVADIIRKHGFNLQGIMTSYEKVHSGRRRVVIRANGAGGFAPLKAELTGSYQGVSIRKG